MNEKITFSEEEKDAMREFVLIRRMFQREVKVKDLSTETQKTLLKMNDKYSFDKIDQLMKIIIQEVKDNECKKRI